MYLARFGFVVQASIGLAACMDAETVVTPTAESGSRTEGVMRLSASHAPSGNARVSWVAAEGVAIRRCQGRGVRPAQAFNRTEESCEQTESSGCCLRPCVAREDPCTV